MNPPITTMFGRIDKKISSGLADFGYSLRGWGSLHESVKKGKSVTKILFSDKIMLNEVLEIKSG